MSVSGWPSCSGNVAVLALACGFHSANFPGSMEAVERFSSCQIHKDLFASQKIREPLLLEWNMHE